MELCLRMSLVFPKYSLWFKHRQVVCLATHRCHTSVDWTRAQGLSQPTTRKSCPLLMVLSVEMLSLSISCQWPIPTWRMNQRPGWPMTTLSRRISTLSRPTWLLKWQTEHRLTLTFRDRSRHSKAKKIPSNHQTPTHHWHVLQRIPSISKWMVIP